MNVQEYRQLLAENTALGNLLQQIPASSVIERIGLEARKKKIEDQLASRPAPGREPARAVLTFAGRPIVRSHGMFAEFGAEAVNAFSKAVAAIGAGLSGSLRSYVTSRHREDYRLLITGTAVGSFGFELEEASDESIASSGESLVDSALEQTKKVMEASLGSDDDLTDAISDTDPRALEALRRFVGVLADQDAVCALEYKGDVFRFRDVGQVRLCENRLHEDNIHEEERLLAGRLLGVLPIRRTFEFQVDKTGEIISGRIGAQIEDARELNALVDEPVELRIHARRAGTGRPRFTLLEFVEDLK